MVVIKWTREFHVLDLTPEKKMVGERLCLSFLGIVLVIIYFSETFVSRSDKTKDWQILSHIIDAAATLSPVIFFLAHLSKEKRTRTPISKEGESRSFCWF